MRRCSPCQRILRALDSLDDVRRKIEEEREPTLRNYRLHPDLILAEPWKTGLKIDQVRQLVQELQGRPYESRGRAVVIDDAHRMTEQAQNALLKSLEEPPATSHVFLVTSAPQMLLTTIRSRCQLFRLGPLPLGLLGSHLEERLGLAPEEARLRAALASGSLGAALAFESDAYRERREHLMALLEGLRGADAIARLEAAEALEDIGDPDATLLGPAGPAPRHRGASRRGSEPRGVERGRGPPTGRPRARTLGRAGGIAGRGGGGGAGGPGRQRLQAPHLRSAGGRPLRLSRAARPCGCLGPCARTNATIRSRHRPERVARS